MVFTYSRGDAVLRMDVQPGSEQVRLSLSHGGVEVVDLLLREVAGLSIERLPKQRRVLRLDLAGGFPGRSLLVTMTPHVFLGWEVGRPDWER